MLLLGLILGFPLGMWVGGIVAYHMYVHKAIEGGKAKYTCDIYGNIYLEWLDEQPVDKNSIGKEVLPLDPRP